VGRRDIGRRQQLSHGHVELLRARCRAANITRMFVVYRIPLNKFWVLTTCCHPIRRRTHTRALFHDTTFHINNNIMTSGTRYCLRNTHAPPAEVGLLLFLLLSSLPTIEQSVLIIFVYSHKLISFVLLLSLLLFFTHIHVQDSKFLTRKSAIDLSVLEPAKNTSSANIVAALLYYVFTTPDRVQT